MSFVSFVSFVSVIDTLYADNWARLKVNGHVGSFPPDKRIGQSRPTERARVRVVVWYIDVGVLLHKVASVGPYF